MGVLLKSQVGDDVLNKMQKNINWWRNQFWERIRSMLLFVLAHDTWEKEKTEAEEREKKLEASKRVVKESEKYVSKSRMKNKL